MALNRPLLAVTGGALAVIAASLGALTFLLLRTGPLAARLIREANALESASYPRPAHVPSPTPGTFAQAMAPHLAALVAAFQAEPQLTGALGEQCRDVANGTAPPSTLPPECRQRLERDRELLHRVLAATHAEAGGLPEGLGVPSSPAHPLQEHGMTALLYAVRLAALETRLQLDAGQADAAVDTCLDALALGRDMALGGGILGRMASCTAQGMAFRPCAAALDAASVARKQQALDELASLRAGLPPFSRSVHEESVQMQLLVYAPLFFSDEERGQLRPRAARMMDVPGFTLLPGPRLMLPLRWKHSAAASDALEASADLPFDARREAFNAIALRPAPGSWLIRLLDAADFDASLDVSRYQQFSERVERQRLQVDALATLARLDAARAQADAWPTALPADVAGDFTWEPRTPSEARITPRDARFAEQALGFTSDARTAAAMKPTRP